MDVEEKKSSARSSDVGPDVEAQNFEKNRDVVNHDITTTNSHDDDVNSSLHDGRVGSTSPATTDPNIVDWDGPNDPKNPLNWSTKAKLANTSLVVLCCFLTPLASSM
jgi:hypothetical protein